MGHPVDELRRRGGDPRADAAPEVALDPVRGLSRAAVGLEALEVEAHQPGPLPEVRVVEVALVLEERVMHLPEPALPRRRLGRRREHAGAWVLRGHREVAEDPPHRQLLEDQMRLRAVRALEVGVLDDHRAVAADVVVGGRLRRGCAAPARQR